MFYLPVPLSSSLGLRYVSEWIKKVCPCDVCTAYLPTISEFDIIPPVVISDVLGGCAMLGFNC